MLCASPWPLDSGHSLSNTEQWTVHRRTNRGEKGEEPAVAGRGAAEPTPQGPKNWTDRHRADRQKDQIYDSK